MEYVRLIHVYIGCVIFCQRIIVDKILDRSYIVVEIQLSSAYITGKASHPVIYRYDIGIETADKVIQRIKRRDLSAGRNVNIYPECRNTVVGVIFGVSVHRNVRLVKMRHHRFGSCCRTALRVKRLSVHHSLISSVTLAPCGS